jgi:hypothetical protein
MLLEKMAKQAIDEDIYVFFVWKYEDIYLAKDYI